jgi:hypothetical protein
VVVLVVVVVAPMPVLLVAVAAVMLIVFISFLILALPVERLHTLWRLAARQLPLLVTVIRAAIAHLALAQPFSRHTAVAAAAQTRQVLAVEAAAALLVPVLLALMLKPPQLIMVALAVAVAVALAPAAQHIPPHNGVAAVVAAQMLAQHLPETPLIWVVVAVAQVVPRERPVAHLLEVALVARPQPLLALRVQPELLRLVVVALRVPTAVPLALVALGALKFGCGNGTNIRTCWA